VQHRIIKFFKKEPSSKNNNEQQFAGENYATIPLIFVGINFSTNSFFFERKFRTMKVIMYLSKLENRRSLINKTIPIGYHLNIS